jgi:osmoprotectant transport system ATP-binding protein
MRDGRLVQCDVPDRILANPADSFVADFVGTDRALKRLSLVTAAEACEAGAATENTPRVPHSASLRDALAIMLGQGVDAVQVANERGQGIGVLTLARIRDRATKGGPQVSVA